MLEVINLSKSYNEKKALDNINFKLENGLVGLLRTKWSREKYINEYYNRQLKCRYRKNLMERTRK